MGGPVASEAGEAGSGNHRRRTPVLYLSYDGMLEPLGQSQVLAYLEKLSDTHAFHILSFEKPADWHDVPRRHALADRMAASGIVWHPLRYHKAPTLPATAFDIAQGTAAALGIALRHRIPLVHARSYIPALIGLQVKRLTGARLLFDMRGLWADERADAGMWPREGRVYRTVKRLERVLLRRSDAVVTLTHASVPILRDIAGEAGAGLDVHVITTCTDVDRFRPDPAAKPPVFTLGYVGSVGTWYRFDDVLRCFQIIAERRPGARLLIVNREAHAHIRARLAAHGIDAGCAEIIAAEHTEVPAAMARMSAGAALTHSGFGKVASAPTKLGEYLACGIPCLGNVDIGDVEQVLEGDGGGVAIRDFSADGLAAAVDRLLAMVDDPATARHCRALAERLFALEGGVAAYRSLYRRLGAC